MKKKETKKKLESKLVGIKIFCPKMEKEIEVSEYSFSAHESECELCGSHGEISVYVKCECGSNHDIEIDSW